MLKTEARKIYLKRRRELSAAEAEEKSRLISERIFLAFPFAAMRTVHLFLPIKKFNEVNTLMIAERIWREFPRIATVAPRVNSQSSELEHLAFSSVSELKTSDWGIAEPVGTQIIDEKEIDAVITPLLCFDKSGQRVGYGKGFYDKFFSRCRPDCLKIGVGFFPPIEKIADANEKDVTLNFCVTPEKVWKF